MGERQETSVMVSIQEILRDAQSREEEEKAEAERRAREEEQRRLDEIRRRQDEEAARLRAEEDERARKIFEEQKRQTELAAMQEAAVARARMEAESKARLAEMTARQEHERQLTALSQDKHKKRLQFILAGLGVLIVAVAVGGGITIKKTLDEKAAAQAQTAQLQGQIDEANANSQKLRAELENTKDPEQIAALQAQLKEQQEKLQNLQQNQQAKPRAPSGGGGGGGGGAARPSGGGGGGGGTKAPCNCTPGDPLCSCL
jgi:colicin import membrane protein